MRRPALLIALLLSAGCGNGGRERLVEAVLAARATGSPVPLPSASGPLSLEEAYAIASACITRNMLGPDAREGISAFLQKRSPRWRR